MGHLVLKNANVFTSHFLDLKIKDIPATAEGLISNILKLNVAMTTVHITGGRAMLESVVKIKKETGSNTGYLELLS